MTGDIIPSAFFDYEDDSVEVELEVEYRVRVGDGRTIIVSGLESDVDRAVAAMRQNAALRARLEAVREVIRPLIQLCPHSNDMRLLHVVAFSKTTAAYDGLDEAIQAAAAWLAGKEGE